MPKEDVLTAEDVWRSDSLRLDIGKHRERRLRQVLERFQGQARADRRGRSGGDRQNGPQSGARDARRSNDARKSADRELIWSGRELRVHSRQGRLSATASQVTVNNSDWRGTRSH